MSDKIELEAVAKQIDEGFIKASDNLVHAMQQLGQAAGRWQSKRDNLENFTNEDCAYFSKHILAAEARTEYAHNQEISTHAWAEILRIALGLNEGQKCPPWEEPCS